jgi:tetratricopeptide (TPR) repeat protein
MEPIGVKPRIFISYSHDTAEHKQRVLRLSERLRKDGIETRLDQYVNGTPAEGWPRWMLNQIDWAEFVLLICTEMYYRRFRGNEEPGKGKGVDWEGAVITQEIYDARSATIKFVPVFFDVADERCIPEPVRGHTFYVLNSEQAYWELYDFLLGQAGVEPGPVGEPQRKPRRRAEPLVFRVSASQPPKIDLTKLPAGAADFLGRGAELQLLDDAWADGGHTQVVELVAPGGVGKTALVKRWLDRLKAEGWRGAQRVYGWSFFSQGTSDDRQASDDNFLSAALGWFAVEHDPALSPWDKGKRLAEAVIASRTLLVLDGVEPLQYPPGPMAGALRTPGLKALLTQLVSSGQPGLCLLTTRERIQNLEEYERRDDYSTGTVVRHDLINLSKTDGARLLHKLGVQRAGFAAITPDDAELQQASREVHGHALTLSLLGSYLAQAHAGDIRQRDKVEFDQANEETRGGYAFKVMAAYEKWFQREGEQGARELAALRLLGYFDRPADAGCLAALRRAPPIPGLTEPLVDLNTAQWNIILSRLKAGGLIELTQSNPPAIDAHPLVREYLAKALRERQPDTWREGHRRLYEHLKASAPYRPDGLAGLQPLYQAVAHGCLAGLPQQAYEEVYRDRILRGTGDDGFYSCMEIGAFGADLGAVACFFEEPWQRLSPALFAADQAWLLNQAAFHLRALGRLSEALEPMRAGLKMRIHQEDWMNAAIVANNLSELQLTLGRVAAAVQDGNQSVAFADRSGDAFWRMGTRTTLADTLYQQGQREPALERFREAEAMQAQWQPNYPLLYSLPGFQYCDLLLVQAERAAWQRQLAPSPWQGEGRGEEIDACHAVEQRAGQALKWVSGRLGLLDEALNHLILGRAALLRAVLDNSAFRTPPSALTQAAQELSAAVDGLRAAGQQQYIPLGLLARAWLHILTNNPTAAHADLDEAWQIASRGDMRLHMADIHLHRARLFCDKAELNKARELIEQYGYWRRKEELEDAEAAARGW